MSEQTSEITMPDARTMPLEETAAAESGANGADLLGGYRLLHRLGEGGMGVVHMGLDTTGRAVAIKVLRDHIAYDQSARARLTREVDTLRRVDHPAVARVIDADVDGPRPYVVTRYVPGPPLDAWVADNGPVSGPMLVDLARGLHDALTAIHEAGVVHRDLKPGNVLILDGHPVVIDFGIAHVAEDTRLTMTGLVMGTPGYLSPEVLGGAPVTQATDWWGWAATLAFAASGHAPFGRGPIDAVIHRVSMGETDLSGVDARLAPLLQAALSPRPGERPSRRIILEGIEAYASGRDTTQLLPAKNDLGTPSTHGLPAPSAAAGSPVTTEMSTSPMAAVPSTSSLPIHLANPETPPAPYAAFTAPPVSRSVSAPAGVGAAAASSADVPGPSVPTAAPPSGSSWIPAASSVPSTPAPAQAWPQAVPPPAELAAQPPTQPPVQPGSHGDPRLGRGARVGTLLSMGTALSALAANMPTIALLTFFVWSALARTSDRTVTSLTLKRYERGARRSDVPIAMLVSPLHLVASLLAALVSLIAPLLIGAAAGLGTQWLLSSVVNAPRGVIPAVPLAVAAFSTALMSWWGIGGTSLRRGSRSLVRGLLPGHGGAVVGSTVALALAAYLAIRAQGTGFRLLWWPLENNFWEGWFSF